MKRSKKLIILASLLAATVIVYFAVTIISAKISEKNSVSEQEGVFSPAPFEAADISTISYSYGSNDFTLVRTDEGWSLDGEPAFNVDAETVDAMADAIVGMSGTRKLEGAMEDSVYGFESPACTVTVKLANGTEYVFKQGDQNAVTEEYYLKANDEVYTIESAIKSAFSKTRNDLYLFDELPDLSGITALTLKMGDESIRVVYKSEPEQYDFAGSANYYLEADTGLIKLDTDTASALFDEAKTLSWYAITECSATSEQLTEYGFDEPTVIATVDYILDSELKSFTMEIGGAYSSYYYYARLPGSNTVYRIDDDLGDLAVAFTLDSYAEKTLLGLDEASLTALTANAGTELSFTVGTRIVEAEETEEEAAEEEATEEEATEEAAEEAATEEAVEETVEEAAEPVTERAVYLDDADVTESFDAMFEYLNALDATGLATEEGGEAVLTLTAEQDNKLFPTVSIEIREFDADSYIAVRSDGMQFTVSADEIDKLIRMLKQF